MTRAVDVDDESIWASTLPDAVYKWTVNSVVDMLPHKSNLVRWHRAVSNCCPLCSRQQTLSHVLSDCPVSLEQGRYTWRHDQILSIIKDGLKNRLLDGFSLECDLPGEKYSYILKTVCSMLRPDIVIYNPKTVVLVELTVPFDERMSEAKQRKEDKYEELIEEITTSGTKAELHTIEVGTRGNRHFAGKISFSWRSPSARRSSAALWSKRDSTEWNWASNYQSFSSGHFFSLCCFTWT